MLTVPASLPCKRKNMKRAFHSCGHWQIKCDTISRIRSTLGHCQKSCTLINAAEHHRMKSVFWKAIHWSQSISSYIRLVQCLTPITVTVVCIYHKNKWILRSSLFRGEKTKQKKLETHFSIIYLYWLCRQYKNCVERVMYQKKSWYNQNAWMYFALLSHQKAALLLIWDTL